MITICHQATRETGVLPIRQSLADTRAANACLARAAWVYLYQLTTGAFCLVRHLVEERAPSGIVDGLCQHSAGQSFDIQIFDGNQAVAIHELPRQLVVEVGSGVEQPPMSSRKQRASLPASIAAFDASSESPLTSSDVGLCDTSVARVIDLCAVAQRSEARKTDIYTDTLGGLWQHIGADLNCDAGVPLAAFPFGRNGLGGAVKSTMQFDFYFANLRQRQSLAYSKAALPEGQRVKAINRSEARVARLNADLAASKKVLKRPIETAQSALKYVPIYCSDIGPVGAHMSKLSALVEEVYRYSMVAPRFTSFLKRGVIQLTTNAKVGLQRFALCVRRIQAITISSPQHLSLYFTSVREAR